MNRAAQANAWAAFLEKVQQIQEINVFTLISLNKNTPYATMRSDGRPSETIARRI